MHKSKIWHHKYYFFFNCYVITILYYAYYYTLNYNKYIYECGRWTHHWKDGWIFVCLSGWMDGWMEYMK